MTFSDLCVLDRYRALTAEQLASHSGSSPSAAKKRLLRARARGEVEKRPLTDRRDMEPLSICGSSGIACGVLSGLLLLVGGRTSAAPNPRGTPGALSLDTVHRPGRNLLL